jgi:hypothetical protein
VSHKKTDAPAADDEKEEAADKEETKTAEATSANDTVRQRKPESKKATLNEAPPSDVRTQEFVFSYRNKYGNCAVLMAGRACQVIVTTFPRASGSSGNVA